MFPNKYWTKYSQILFHFTVSYRSIYQMSAKESIKEINDKTQMNVFARVLA